MSFAPVNLGYGNADLDTGGSTGDLTAALGVNMQLAEVVGIYADYSFEDDLNQESSYSITKTHIISKSNSAQFGYARDGVVYAAYTVNFWN